MPCGSVDAGRRMQRIAVYALVYTGLGLLGPRVQGGAAWLMELICWSSRFRRESDAVMERRIGLEKEGCRGEGFMWGKVHTRFIAHSFIGNEAESLISPLLL